MPGRKVPQGNYSAFVPAPLPPKLEWTPRLMRVLSDADRLIGKLAGEGGRLPNPHILMRPFLQPREFLFVWTEALPSAPPLEARPWSSKRGRCGVEEANNIDYRPFPVFVAPPQNHAWHYSIPLRPETHTGRNFA
jgi:hypothetical protein